MYATNGIILFLYMIVTVTFVDCQERRKYEYRKQYINTPHDLITIPDDIPVNDDADVAGKKVQDNIIHEVSLKSLST